MREWEATKYQRQRALVPSAASSGRGTLLPNRTSN
uniref:Uncharacterized protein n=1 Tax=Arundo donax TaxID=35708 RepID=A0A0A9BNK4_ARUDO